MKKATAILLGLVVLSACGKKDDSAGKGPEKVTRDALTSSAWCVADEVSPGMKLVTRYQFSPGDPGKVDMSYLWPQGSDLPATYLVSRNDWQLDGGFAPVNSLRVELVDDPDRVASLKGYWAQTDFFDRHVRGNATLGPAGDQFVPRRAVILKLKTIFDLEDTSKVLYPCASYAQGFVQPGEARPTVELNVALGQSAIGMFGSPALLASSMALALPLESLSIADVVLEGTSWCAWFEMEREGFLVKVATFAKDRFIESTVTDVAFRHGRELLGIDRDPIYTSSVANAVLRGKPTSNLTWGFTLEQAFTAVRDTRGTVALVDTNPARPEAMSIKRHQDIYFSCDDARPFEAFGDIRANLGRIVELQKAALAEPAR
jgi:hypothetical protein